jgi:hypothetical protein
LVGPDGNGALPESFYYSSGTESGEGNGTLLPRVKIKVGCKMGVPVSLAGFGTGKIGKEIVAYCPDFLFVCCLVFP